MNNEQERKFNIIIPLYNVEKWIKYCIRSVKAQEYGNFHCYLVDDISTDNTSKIIKNEIEGDNRFTLIENKEKKYALLNIHDTIELAKLDANDVVVLLDGDDWFPNKTVLQNLNRVYNSEACDMTYGSYVEYPSGIKGKFAKQVPHDIVENLLYRESEWMTSHLRTFKHSLWQKIDNKDFVYSQTQKFYKASWDLAFMFPMLEMAGHKAHYVDEVMYVYNRQNPLNEDKVNHGIQLAEEAEIRKKNKYERL